MAKPRLFVEIPLHLGQEISLDGDAHHYLSRVMRLKEGDVFEVFNGESPSFDARVLSVEKKTLGARIEDEAAAFLEPPHLRLAFAPIKKARTDFIVEKAAELGVRELQPVVTEFTNSERVRVDRLQRHVIEAVEQCGGNFVPQIAEAQDFAVFLARNDLGQILFCDELADVGEGVAEFAAANAPFWTIIIGPEGGFSEAERRALMAHGALRLSLGPRILRADTAAVAAIALWQKTHGDW